MRKLSLNILLLIFAFVVTGQDNPHGKKFQMDCLDCHTTEGWKFVKTGKFDHNKTQFILEGQHEVTSCAACHTTLVFSEAKTSCIDCHTDMHNSTVGTDCAQCHNSNSWIVSNITELHQMSRFPLLGAHNSADCSSCHTSASRLEFEPLGVECIDCHRQDYMTTNNPNHIQTGLSTNCIECHKIDAHEWSASGINHDFFPLSKGHEITTCVSCHVSGLTEPLSTDCYSCHQNDYLSATNPSHQNSGFSTNCEECHTIDPDWKPAEFKTHDALFFPIYSGKHNGEWNNCTDCHTQAENYSVFSCTDCHEHNRAEMDDEHDDVAGYSYNSTSCFACHPSGNEESAFNHNATDFPLKGAHLATECASCHTTTYAGTSMDCNHCHATHFNQASNPNHVSAGISTDCATCHTENGWTPSNFDHVTTSGFELTGGHSGRQCVDCHQGTTSAASSDCISCHQANYNEAENHVAQGFPTNCLQCHSTNSWEAANFDHNNTSFALTGAHIATECSACHTTEYAGTSTLCNDCHNSIYTQAQNPSHSAAGISNECETCHGTTAWTPSDFDHLTTSGFELNGGHSGKQCVDCHQGTTSAANSDCISCHQANYNEAENHVAQGFPTNCLQCHSTNSWEAANFDHNNTNFALTGAHIATECSACHTTGYAGTSTLCNDCHNSNYTQTQNPSHTAAGISNECETCHGTTAWTPSDFDHLTTSGFELTGGHSGRQCVDCHQGTTSAANSDCISCHQANYNEAKDHAAQSFPTNCLLCHNNTDWTQSTFDHNATSFALTGAHTTTDCASCHTSGYQGTTNLCSECHQTQYSSTTNPNHASVGIAVQCEDCHTTGPGWDPALFPNHNDYYALNGAHAAVANNCYLCHSGNYITTPNTCYACHTNDYNTAADPNHLTLQFSTDCQSCHSENAWEPSTFDHDNQYFPIYSGRHREAWNSCSDCHTEPSNYSVFSCITCHEHNQTDMDKDHDEENGYVYNSTNCLACHPTGVADD
jgi:hypothetical protein